ncbi:hypothetical protein IMG5_063790 [Ichthyophthirius multifiliis]|uniref:Uncharacterized protein n=1 Tax=Ichthyophthirius multifiliis TaxID=5932 RepID=G0QP42_ICHMU|nr:hypothetical protein IMG5_063790 [Ichthyophthirius multifiliis]EGR33008.1 hypothetical protein IMG5_063790 [Ichthyophthirius multifiliis]|eukprot:XP_004036994.1 hypothetical protein IMG5_063790 [Ichthyophthirius multifiliis]
MSVGQSLPQLNAIQRNYMPLVEMYNITTRQNTTWGIDGYEVPKRYFDHLKQVQDREYEKINKKGKYVKNNKYVTKRGCYLDDTIKLFKTSPAPNKYEVSYKWVNQQDIEKGKKKPKDTKRNTFIDDIFLEEKRRIKPGPGQYKIFFKTQAEVKETDKVIKERRQIQKGSFLNENEYLSIKTPGPGNYNPRGILPKLKVNMKKPQDFINLHKEQTKKGKLSNLPDVGTYKFNFPLDYDTFGKMLVKGKQKTAVKYLGTQIRFKDLKSTKSKSVVIGPGPGHYQMIAQWPGKLTLKDKKNEKAKNYLNLLSSGLQKSIYYE